MFKNKINRRFLLGFWLFTAVIAPFSAVAGDSTPLELMAEAQDLLKLNKNFQAAEKFEAVLKSKTDVNTVQEARTLLVGTYQRCLNEIKARQNQIPMDIQAWQQKISAASQRKRQADRDLDFFTRGWFQPGHQSARRGNTSNALREMQLRNEVTNAGKEITQCQYELDRLNRESADLILRARTIDGRITQLKLGR